MVFLSLINFTRNRGASQFWRKRQVYALTSHFKGRKRNVFKLAIIAMRRALQFNRLSRPLKKKDMIELWETRITAGCEEHGLPYRWFHEGIVKAGICLNRKVLSELAVWEPRTFGALTRLAWHSVKDDGRKIDDLGPPPEGVATRGKLH